MKRLLRSPLIRLAWQLPIVTVLILGVVLVPTYREAVRDIEHEVHAAINEEIISLTEEYTEHGTAGLIAAVDARHRGGTDRAAVYLLVDGEGVRIAGAEMRWPEGLSAAEGEWFRVPEENGDTLDGKVFQLVGGDRLLVARRSPLKQFRERLSRRLVMATVLAFAGSLLIAGYTLGRYRQRLAQIQDSARYILSGNLAQRLKLAGRDDELDELANEFNQAFAEIEKLMEATRHVSSAIAHDMRRPISALRYRLEELSRHPDLPSDMREALNALLEQTDAALNTFSALLRLARLESGSYGPNKEALDLKNLLQEVVETYEPVAAAHEMRFTSQLHSAWVSADANLLFLALQNIIDNAINYGSTQIDVRLDIQQERARIEIRDHGPGVPEESLPRLFERFYRGDSARTEGGSGIGLALVRAVAEVHGGEVSARNAQPGLAVTMVLPLSDASS